MTYHFINITNRQNFLLGNNYEIFETIVPFILRLLIHYGRRKKNVATKFEIFLYLFCKQITENYCEFLNLF